MKFLNKTNLYTKEPIGLYSNLKNMRYHEFSFESIEPNLYKIYLDRIIDQIQSFCLLIFQNQKV